MEQDEFKRNMHARPPFQEMHPGHLNRQRLRIEPGSRYYPDWGRRGHYPRNGYPWERNPRDLDPRDNLVDNYWGQREERRQFRPGEPRVWQSSVGGRSDVTSGHYYNNDLPAHPLPDWADEPDDDLDPGYDYEFGTDFDFFDTLDAFDASRREDWREPWDIPGPFQGIGPLDYHASDERVQENISEALSRSSRVNASGLRVQVENGLVTLNGEVQRREEKYLAEEIALQTGSVRDVDNLIRVRGTRR